MDHGERSELIRVLSPDRFSTYLSAAAGDEDLAFRLYEWNDSCSEIFVRPLRWLEVALRNALHAEMTRLVGRPDWWEKRSLLLTDVHRRMIDEAVERLRRNGKLITDGRVVAELSFGFWVGLLGPGRNYEMVLWRPALRHAFAGYRTTRKELHHALDSLRTLRNRLAHGEPVFQRDLSADYADILRLLHVLSETAARRVRATCRVGDALTSRPLRRGAAR